MPNVKDGRGERVNREWLRRPANVKLILACLAMVWLGAVVRRPYLIAGQMEAENRRDERRVADLKKQNLELRKDIQALDTPQGMEREARRLGYVKQGEALLVVP